MKTKSKKLLTMLLVLCMALVPITAFANGGGTNGGGQDDDDVVWLIKLEVTANVTIKDVDGNVLETTEVNESGDYIELEDTDARRAELERILGNIEAQFASRGTVTTVSTGSTLYVGGYPDITVGSITYKHMKDHRNYIVTVQEGGGQQDDPTITAAAIENVKFNYQVGEAPQKMASIKNLLDMEKYEVAYECWQEMENGNPVAYWYSDESKYPTSAERITLFEAGKTYMYFIELKAKDGYTFADDCAVTITDTGYDTINVPTANVHKTTQGLFIRAVKEIQPVELQEIPIVEINNVTVTFKDGDTPVFTGTVAEND
jgi:hypothetical protein